MSESEDCDEDEDTTEEVVLVVVPTESVRDGVGMLFEEDMVVNCLSMFLFVVLCDCMVLRFIYFGLVWFGLICLRRCSGEADSLLLVY